MRLSTLIPGVLLTAASLSTAAPSSHSKHPSHGDHKPISPKAFIISMVYRYFFTYFIQKKK
jgi:hypothetical protein